MYREENNSMLKSRFYRPDEIRKARKVVNAIKTGQFVKATIYKFTYEGTCLGYKHTPRGWVMGLLLCSGKVKDVSIDPSRWFDGENAHFVEVDRTVYVIFNHGYRLVLEPISRTGKARRPDTDSQPQTPEHAVAS
jgi:hypothetical protein